MHTFTKIRRGPDLRAKAMAIAAKRKEEYLGARVPRELKERVIQRAEELDIPVSILIRRVLEDAFGNRRSQEATTGYHNSDPERASKFPSVLGWESIRLNKTARCTGCGSQLKAGKQILMGIASSEEERVLLCDICKEAL